MGKVGVNVYQFSSIATHCPAQQDHVWGVLSLFKSLHCQPSGGHKGQHSVGNYGPNHYLIYIFGFIIDFMILILGYEYYYQIQILFQKENNQIITYV